ncbi:MAG: hypothetical protein LBT09_06605 [Planctomycetaceae bacterium]|jgi:hypothetical protein|nr:hypothetical protein [Planctomycetaceae bacterium]
MSDFRNEYSIDTNRFDSTPISSELNERVDKELWEGETIEWIDKPIPCYFTEDTIRAFFVASVWTVFAISWTICVPVVGGLSGLLGVLFILVGFGGMMSSPIFSWCKMSRTVYVITNRRVITIEKKMFLFDVLSYDADEIGEFNMQQKDNGTGNVFVFQNIRNVKEVEQKLRKLKSTAQHVEDDDDSEQ